MITYTKEEWRELTRPLWPVDWSDADFDRAWKVYWDRWLAMFDRKTMH